MASQCQAPRGKTYSPGNHPEETPDLTFLETSPGDETVYVDVFSIIGTLRRPVHYQCILFHRLCTGGVFRARQLEDLQDPGYFTSLSSLFSSVQFFLYFIQSAVVMTFPKYPPASYLVFPRHKSDFFPQLLKCNIKFKPCNVAVGSIVSVSCVRCLVHGRLRISHALSRRARIPKVFYTNSNTSLVD